MRQLRDRTGAPGPMDDVGDLTTGADAGEAPVFDAAAPPPDAAPLYRGVPDDVPLSPPSPRDAADFGARSPEVGGAKAGGFRFSSASDDNKMVAGLDKNDEKLLRNAYLIGGRLLTGITLFSLVFYIYVGVTGGITDGFDRYTEPIEDIRDTMAREGVSPVPDYFR